MTQPPSQLRVPFFGPSDNKWHYCLTFSLRSQTISNKKYNFQQKRENTRHWWDWESMYKLTLAIKRFCIELEKYIVVLSFPVQ